MGKYAIKQPGNDLSKWIQSLDDLQPVSLRLIAFSICICLSNNESLQKAHFLFGPV